MYIYCHYFFFFNDTATTEIYTLSLHDALPISAFRDSVKGQFQQKTGQKLSFLPFFAKAAVEALRAYPIINATVDGTDIVYPDRKSTRLNSSHANISYAVFCLKKKKQ